VIRLLRRFALLFVLLTGLAFAQAASPAAQNTPKSTDTDLVTCGERPPYASRTVKSEPMVAPDGKHKAYSEVEATALHPQRPAGYSGPLCVNNSRLFVTGDNGEFKTRFMQEPADVENGNSLRLIDWSSDGRRLLAELAEWQYEQPGVVHSVLLYDSRYGTFQQPEFPHLLAKTYDHECSLDFRVLGFGLRGKIVLEGNPLTPEEEEIQGLSSCVKKKTYFELDRATETLVSVQEMPKVQHNAKSEASK
jgi:hypothetical protein